MTQEELRRAIQMMAEAVAKERASRFGDGADVNEDDIRMAVAAYNALHSFMVGEEMVFYRP